MRTIQKDDVVTIIMTRGDCFGFQTSPSFTAIVMHTPDDTGDIWYFKVEKLDVAINPMSSEFIGIVKDESHHR